MFAFKLPLSVAASIPHVQCAKRALRSSGTLRLSPRAVPPFVDQRIGALRWQHAVGGAYEQRVAQFLAQPRQLDADRRVVLAQRLGRTRHAAAGVWLVEQAQQLDVEQRDFRKHGDAVLWYFTNRYQKTTACGA